MTLQKSTLKGGVSIELQSYQGRRQFEITAMVAARLDYDFTFTFELTTAVKTMWLPTST